MRPLLTRERSWLSVSMDFIMGFPKVDGKDMIMVVIDWFSKYVMFVATQKACNIETIVKLFFKHVVKYFMLPEDIVSDQDERFIGRFWTWLFNSMGSKLKFSTANHPQTNGQTKKINALLEEYLRHYVTTS